MCLQCNLVGLFLYQSAQYTLCSIYHTVLQLIILVPQFQSESVIYFNLLVVTSIGKRQLVQFGVKLPDS